MNSDIFVSICRQQVVGRCHHLDEAIRLARERTEAEFLDVVIWQGTEALCAVLAGRVVPLAETWAPTCADSEPVLVPLSK